MRYWPLSVIKSSPLMPAAHQWELEQFYSVPPSRHAYHACLYVANNTPSTPAQGLAAIETVGALLQLIYTGYPTWEEWSRLERACAIGDEDGEKLYLMMGVLH